MKIAFLFFILISTNAFATYSQDSGQVSEVFVNASGSIALKLKDGFPKAISSGQCTVNNGWAGLSEAAPILKSTILTAKVSQLKLVVTIEGCNGAWFKIKDLYLK